MTQTKSDKALKDERSSHSLKPGFQVKPPMLLAALYAAGLVGFVEILRTPGLHGVLWNQSAAIILLFGGSLISAMLLILIHRRSSITPVKAQVLMVVVIVLAALTALLSILAAAFPAQSLMMGMGSLFLASCSMPFAIYLWVLVYRSLSFRNVLLNSSLAYVFYALLLYLSVQVFTEFSYVICAVLLFVGSVALLLSRRALASSIREDSKSSRNSKSEDNNHPVDNADENNHPVENADENTNPLRFLVSIPFTGLALYAITTGLVLRGNEGTSPLFDITGAVIAIAIVLVFIAVKSSHLPDHRLMFYVYELGLPAIAVIAFIIKMIPIDFFSELLFQEFMKFYFQILALAAWTYLVGSMRHDSTALSLVCGAAQAVLSISLLIGYLASEVGYPFDTTFLGLITAFFLLFAIATVGRNTILFVKGPETSHELEKKPLDIEAVCAIVNAEYKLSPRENDVLKELAYGHSSSYVAKVLFISNNTARTHMKNIYKKLDINSREDLLEIIREKQKSAP